MEQGTLPGAAPLDDLERRAPHSERLRANQALQRDRSPLTLIKVAACGTRIVEEALQQAERAVPPPCSACKEGCDWCCHLTVGTSVPEVIRLLDYLRQNLSPEDFAAFQERVARLDEQRRALRVAGRSEAGVPCALLVDHCCIAYPVRPLMCRGFNSSDATACERFLQSSGQTSVPLYAP